MDDVSRYLCYDKWTGELLWADKPNKKIIIGSVAGSVSDDGYIRLKFNKVRYLAHRIAWYLHYGKWPEGFIDHINRDRGDNRIENLREVSKRVNSQNQESYNRGAHFVKSRNKWRSRICVNGKEKTLGYFRTEQEAQETYLLNVAKEG